MITIYTTPSCVYCKVAKEYFKKEGLEYKEVDVVLDEAAREDMIKKSGQMGVPVIEINGKIVIGFNKREIDQALGK
ncbi:MAG: NrdH-redoxin [Candidatus Colwellbacteria bacterium RIFCSPLOWO2_01_FULL_48_10]|uniref:NrdH-redoxin n=2 Tax=Bacteria candidate phyla TaxID=1783234 RepID=A0A1F5NZG8_9BACT|nr:MAG: NrdH-redoxin [Candidatus Doudnabacteria bacterium RIFCSPHIGHO2_01_FULL_49_9]OGY60099.1 MAG: NrdH-redoxin [Candidatus Colwellbacteria bacterium RIFCSPLOWO2_01_FULL_48_10]